MTKLGVTCAGAVGAAGIAMALVGQGVAGADPLSVVTGKYYGEAKQVLSNAGLTPIVATRVGDRANDDECVIDRIQPANFTSGTGSAASRTVYVYLNCYANVASTQQPGYSRASPLGRSAYEAQQQQAAQQQAAAEQQAQSEESVTAENPH